MLDSGWRMVDVGKPVPYIHHPPSTIQHPSWCSPQYVTNKNQNAENHHQRVVLRIAGLNEADGPAEGLDESADEPDRAVDNPSIPPIGPVCTPGRCSCRAIHQTVHNFCIESPQRSSRILRPVYEKSVV